MHIQRISNCIPRETLAHVPGDACSTAQNNAIILETTQCPSSGE